MAELNRDPATSSTYVLEQTILFLRPTTKDAILGVDATENDYCRFEVCPPEEPTDTLVDDETLIETTLEVAPQSQTPVKAPHNHPFALRLGFDTIENPSRDGFTVGGLGCNINLPTLEAKCCFVIHYVMQSGALMISAHVPISIGDTDLRFNQSLLLMHRSKIRCETVNLVVEFPNISRLCPVAQGPLSEVLRTLGLQRSPIFSDLIGSVTICRIAQGCGKTWARWLWDRLQGGAQRQGHFVCNEVVQWEAKRLQGS